MTTVLLTISVMLFPIFGAFLLTIVWIKETKIKRAYSIPIGLFFGVIGYNLFSRNTSDLTRYMEMLHEMSGLRIRDITLNNTSLLYTRDILFYFIAQTGDYWILPFVVGMITYGVVFYVFFDVCNRYEFYKIKNSKYHFVFIGILMLAAYSPFEIINNVRNVLAFVLISFACYRDMVQQKKNFVTLLLYIIPIGLHTSAIILVAVRFVQSWVKRKEKILISLIFLLPILIEGAYNLFSNIRNSNVLIQMIKFVVNKAYWYLNWTEGGWADVVDKSLSNTISRIYCVFFLMFVLIILFLNNETAASIKTKTIKDGFSRYLYIVAVLALGSLNIKTGAYWRFEAVVVLFISVILVPIIVSFPSKKIRYMINILYIGGTVMFLLEIVKFVRNVDMLDFFSGMMLTNVFEILISIVKSFFY